MDRRWVIWVRNIVVLLVVAAFVVVFGQPSPGPTLAPVAEVDGEPIAREVFDFFREQNEALLREDSAEPLDSREVQEFLDRQTLEALVLRQLVAQEAVSLGLWVAGSEVHGRIVADPSFGPGGRFDPELFERFVVRSGLGSPRLYTEEVRKDLLVKRFQRAVLSPVRLSTAAARDAIRRERVRLRLRLAIARPEAFRPVEVAPERVSAFAEANGDRLLAEYERRLDEFVQPEQVRARHILFTGEGALERAEETLRRIRGGEDFAALAKALSEDPATAEAGGDLGFFPRGRMLPTFDAAAFALEPGEVSEPVETTRGVHLIQLEERQEGVERTLDEVSLELARDLLTVEEGSERARQAAEEMAARLERPDSFDESARAAGLELRTSTAFGWSDAAVPGLGPSPELRAAALTLTSERPSPARVFALPEGYVLISLLEREEPTEEEILSELERVREEEEQALRARLVTRWYEELRAALIQRDGVRRAYPTLPEG